MAKIKPPISEEKYKKILTGTSNVARNTGLALGDTVMSAVGLTDVVRDDMYKGSTADGFAIGGNVGGTIAKTALPLALSTVGVPPAVTAAGQQAIGGTANKALLDNQAEKEASKVARENQSLAYMSEPAKTKGLGSYVQYEKGGKTNHTVVNIEKDELEVNPKTGEIVSDYRNKPKHPKGKDIINLKGNVAVKEGNVIIPAKMRDAYMKGDKNMRLEIIHEVVEAQREREGTPKMIDGGLPIMETQLDTIEEFNPTFNAKGAGTPAAKTAGNNSLAGVDSGNLAGMASAVPNLIYGAQQTKESKKALEKLQKTPMARYSLAEQQQALGNAQNMENAAKARARFGFTPAEQANYQQSLARAQNTDFARAQQMGGANIAQAISASQNQQRINGLLDYASRNAGLQRQNQAQADQAGRYTNQMLGQLASQKNAQTNVDIQNRIRQEEALGRALSQGRTNVTNATGSLAGFGTLAGSQALGASTPAPSTSNIDAASLQKLIGAV
jgi:hypothetical protein